MLNEQDDFLRHVFNAQNVTGEEKARLIKFFPEGCFFNWDGKGEEPIGSMSIMRGFSTVEEACRPCRIEECSVRRAPYGVNLP